MFELLGKEGIPCAVVQDLEQAVKVLQYLRPNRVGFGALGVVRAVDPALGRKRRTGG